MSELIKGAFYTKKDDHCCTGSSFWLLVLFYQRQVFADSPFMEGSLFSDGLDTKPFGNFGGD